MKKIVVILVLVVCSLLLFDCSKKKKEVVETRNIEQILRDSLSSKSTDNNFFLGFHYGMNAEEYNKVRDNLFTEKKAEYNTDSSAVKGSFKYKFYLKNNICKTIVNPFFDKDNKLEMLVILYDTPAMTSVENIGEQTLDFLKSTCGKITLINNHLAGGQAFNSRIFHFVRGKIYTSYMFSELTAKHTIRYTSVEHETKLMEDKK